MNEEKLYNSPDVAKKIKVYSKIKKVSLKCILKYCNLGQNTFSHMLHGKVIAFDSLAKIADYLDCSVDYLLGRTEDPNSHKTANTETPTLSVAIRAARSADDKPMQIVERDESKFINAPAKKL